MKDRSVEENEGEENVKFIMMMEMIAGEHTINWLRW